MTIVSEQYRHFPKPPCHHWSEIDGGVELIRTKTAEKVARISYTPGGCSMTAYESALPLAPMTVRTDAGGTGLTEAEAVELAIRHANEKMETEKPAAAVPLDDDDDAGASA